MSQFQHPGSSGAPSFTAASARPSLSGLDLLAFSAEPNLLDPADWLHGPVEHQLQDHPPLSSHDALFSPDLGHSFPPSAVPHTLQGAQRPQPPFPPGPRQLYAAPLSQPTLPSYSAPENDGITSFVDFEEPVTADQGEDKRKRNQAASARFRQKKKQREQHILEQSRAISDKNKKLEDELQGLKRENTFLRKLLVEKVDKMSEEERGLLIDATEIGHNK